jgi:CheY-like chemotaxis protein
MPDLAIPMAEPDRHLPEPPPSLAAPRSIRLAAHPTLWGGTALRVDNTRFRRQATASTLARLGFVVLEARDGMENVDLVRQYQDTIRSVLGDVTMPHTNGWETVATLARASPDVRVILAVATVSPTSAAEHEQHEENNEKPEGRRAGMHARPLASRCDQLTSCSEGQQARCGTTHEQRREDEERVRYPAAGPLAHDPLVVADQ